MTDAEEPTPLQKARMRAAALAIKEGRVIVPLECAWCHSSTLYRDTDDRVRLSEEKTFESAPPTFTCGSCGRKTTETTARTQRRLRMAAIIRRGVDVPGLIRTAK